VVLLSFDRRTKQCGPAAEFLHGARIDDAVLLDGGYSGRLSDAGEKLRLLDPNWVLNDQVAYDDRAPWSVQADGRGGPATTGRNAWGDDPES